MQAATPPHLAFIDCVGSHRKDQEGQSVRFRARISSLRAAVSRCRRCHGEPPVSGVRASSPNRQLPRRRQRTVAAPLPRRSAPVLEPRQRGDAIVAARARRVPRAHGRIRRRSASSTIGTTSTGSAEFRLTRPSRHSQLLSFQVQAQDARVATEDGRPDRRAVQGAVRSAHGVRRRRRREDACRRARRPPGAGVRRAAARRPRELAERRAHLRRRQGHVPHERAFTVDAFAASVVRILDGEFDKSGNGNRFAGAYATTTKLVPHGIGRAVRVLAARREPADRDRRRSATSVRPRSACGWPAGCRRRLDYGIEMALQRGSLGTDDVQAWAGHWQLRETLPGARRRASHRRIQLRLRRRRPHRRRARHVRPALSDAARQVRPGRSGRLEEHPPRARRRRVHAGEGPAGHDQLPLVVAGRETRDGSTPPAARRSRA